jgi:hypothetical protein
MAIAVSSAQSLASRLMDLVARLAARASAPTWSTPGSPCSTCRSAASDVATSDGHARSVIAWGACSMATARRYLTARSTASLAAFATAKPGLSTVLMMCSRWSNGANALFIALTVSHSTSDQP